ncbi:4-alpha-glucanotransferase [Thalassotalea sp. PLHSN55]|uniref:4-alpha-glucanotransferase n=1 Tax=Thalassotalea sp. PLHSN55 TaxID=3435888 RepID=UPI003F872477
MNLIEKLAELVGFHASYLDCFGREVFAKDQARQSLLTAMGYDLSCDNALQASIRDLQESSWRNLLPPVHIAKLEQSQHHILVSLPSEPVKKIDWQITTEHGEQIHGSSFIADLVATEQTHLATAEFTKYQMPLPSLAQGYHQLTVSFGKQTATCPLIYAPQKCYRPEQASKEKVWGYAAQLYSLRSDNNWGMGDFGDLKALVKKSAEQQASVIGLNPLHPLYQNNPAHRSPYSPTSRCFLNTMYIDVTQVPNYRDCQKAQELVASDAFQAKVNFAKTTELIDYPAVADVKYQVLELLFTDFSSNAKTELAQEFSDFKAQQGQDLLKLTTFDALYEHFRSLDEHAFGWSAWPQAYQQPNSAAVKEFQQSHRQRIDYFAFLQWLAHRQLSDVRDTAKAQGMPIGLYLDLAVGCDGSGVDVWSDKDVYVAGAAVGAPPDAMNVLGQDWGLTPINPVALQEQGFLPLVKALRSNMQYAGALRIDHILGLMRQYWVAPGMAADEGVYITFPLESILRIIALESQRSECVVIGEDLGTVPEGFGEIMESAGLLSYKVLFFETWESGLFMRPELYPAQSMVTVSTHDLPTLSGWWQGRDLQWRQNLHLYPDNEMGPAERKARVDERQCLLAALTDLNVLAPEDAPQAMPAVANSALSLAVQEYLALAPSHIQLIPLEDALEIKEQVNIPGTIDEHPNWRQKLPVNLAELWQTSSVESLAQLMQKARPRNV